MIPDFEQDSDNLPPGQHQATWQGVVERFGYTPHRRYLLDGLRRGLDALAAAGCRRVWLDGSFVTAKAIPNDFDACWDAQGVDFDRLDPVLLDLSDGRAAQHAKYRGALMRADHIFPEGEGGTVLDGQQRDYITGRPKGIIELDPREDYTSER